MFAGNSKVLDGLIIAGLSIVKSCKEPINVYVLTMDLTDRNKDYQELDDSAIERLQQIYQRGNKESSKRKRIATTASVGITTSDYTAW